MAGIALTVLSKNHAVDIDPLPYNRGLASHVLHQVFGFGGASEHLVSDTEQTRPQSSETDIFPCVIVTRRLLHKELYCSRRGPSLFHEREFVKDV